MSYSPLNPIVWLLFFVGIALIFLSVKTFHRYFPNYPEKTDPNRTDDITEDGRENTGYMPHRVSAPDMGPEV